MWRDSSEASGRTRSSACKEGVRIVRSASSQRHRSGQLPFADLHLPSRRIRTDLDAIVGFILGFGRVILLVAVLGTTWFGVTVDCDSRSQLSLLRSRTRSAAPGSWLVWRLLNAAFRANRR